MEYQIGEIISNARQNAHMTQEEFASRLGVTPQAVSKWERGQGLPDDGTAYPAMVEALVQICREHYAEIIKMEYLLRELILQKNYNHVKRLKRIPG